MSKSEMSAQPELSPSIKDNVELIKKFMSPNSTLEDLKQFFSLSAKDLTPILEKHAADMLIVNKDSNFQFSFLRQLYNNLKDKNINLSEGTIEKIVNIGCESYQEILKFTPSLITQTDLPLETNSLVQRLLAKTYVLSSSCGPMTKKEFARALSDKLNQVISENPSIEIILRQAATGEGDIFIVNSVGYSWMDSFNNSGPGRYGICLTPSKESYSRGVTDCNIFIKGVTNTNSISLIVAAIVHECTHKAIEMQYHNNTLPYQSGDKNSSMTIYKAIAHETIKSKKSYFISALKQLNPNTNWLQFMVGSYPSDEHPKEVLAWLTENLALNLLGITRAGMVNVSFEFAQTMWELLQQALIIPIKINNGEVGTVSEVMPDCLSLTLDDSLEINDNKAKQAWNLIEAGPISVEWFASDVWKLAVRGSYSSAQNEFIDDLFRFDAGKLKPFLELYAVDILVHKETWRDTFIERLFSLHQDLLESILDNNAIKLLEAAGSINFPDKIVLQIFSCTSVKFRQSFIKKLFASSEEALQSFFNKFAADLFEIKGLDQEFFFQELFTLKESVLQLILESHGVYWLLTLGQAMPEVANQLYIANERLLSPIFRESFSKGWEESNHAEREESVSDIIQSPIFSILKPLLPAEMLVLLADSSPALEELNISGAESQFFE